MPNLTRRGFIAATVAAGSVRALPQIAKAPPARRILTLVYDKSVGAVRAVERVVR
ncbi:Tat pathway signal protein [uncultured Litoreibacter sp.]|uniref:Tat pathway signal protein n=1 Tax=uncultured Litoreibacter sp. TaxID=1392394 RepID=UPI00260E2401|nr:Tat pathway signal protein [uncultured Litoreibacter sp.]